MDEEKQLLLGGASGRESSKETDTESEIGDSSESLTIKLDTIRIARYGTDNGSMRKTIPVEERITYTWNDLNAFTTTEVAKRKYICCGPRKVSNTQQKHILQNVSGIAYPGELLAILGSSGSGKTTLLNALTCRSTKNVAYTGMRSANGVPVNLKAITSVSAYVQQDDLFIGSLTVREHLVFQALVRMDKHISYEQRMKRVEEVLSELGLKKCEHTVIGIPGRAQGVSGGEKKRLSFAAEVLTNPSLMFCDEPTSGLDSFMALNVVQVLKSMSRIGKTVVCTIHQPSSELYAMFDKLLLMCEGRVAFLGTPEEANIFFSELEAPCPKNFNPADYFIQLLAIVPGREESCRQANSLICNKYQRSDIGVRIAVGSATIITKSGDTEFWMNNENHASPYKASWCAQFRAVLWRSWLSIMKNPNVVKIRLIQTAMVSLITGALYYGQQSNEDGVFNINGVIFIFLTNMTFQNLFAVITVFCSELPVFLREHENGMYRTEVYFISKTIAEIPFFVVLPVLFVSLCYYMIGLNSEQPRFFIACGLVILVTNVATSFGYMVSCFSGSTSLALSLGQPLAIPFLLFGGFFLNVKSIPIYFEWLSYLSWFRYGNEALLINQWEGVTNIECTTSSCPKDGHTVLRIFSFAEDNFMMDVIGLVCLIILFRLMAYFGLLYRIYRSN